LAEKFCIRPSTKLLPIKHFRRIHLTRLVVTLSSTIRTVKSKSAGWRLDPFHVLDGLDGGREVGDQMVRVRIEADDNGVGKKLSYLVIAAVRVEDGLVNAGNEILPKTANGFRRAENGPPDAGIVELYQGAIALLDLNDAVLNCHVG
jgi:hypothetical protein